MVEVACITPLFVRGNRPERFAKAAAAGTDAVIIDLEDAVAPDNKAAARNAICQPGALPQGVDIFVRINDCQTPWFHDDITAVAKLRVTGILLPKSNAASDIVEVMQHSPGSQVIALIETACGLAAAREIAQAAGMAVFTDSNTAVMSPLLHCGVPQSPIEASTNVSPKREVLTSPPVASFA